MPYKASTNVYGKRLIKAGEIITDSEYNSLSTVPRNRFVFLEPDPAPNPAGQSAGDEQSSADQSAEETVPFYEEKIIQGIPEKDPDIVTYNPDREYLNDAAKAKKSKQNKNK